MDSKSDESFYITISLLGEEMACMRLNELARLDKPDMESELQEYLRQNDSKRFVMSVSVYREPETDRQIYFYAHPEFIRLNDDGIPVLEVCSSCHNF